MATQTLSIYDPLYGQIEFHDHIVDLIRAPLIQRLRHIRLSNIDSLSMPGIANISRFEHVVGTAALATNLAFFNTLSSIERTTVMSAALLHDWAITAFGHLVEEAFRYVGTSFSHENRLYEIIAGSGLSEVGGINRQILCGRETGLSKWAEKVTKTAPHELLKSITDSVRGKGIFGSVIAGSIDLDNIDNVHRMAYHMGLAIDRDRPKRLAQGVKQTDPATGTLTFARQSEPDIEAWLALRKAVYERLMPAEPDFACKVMILSAAVELFRAEEMTEVDWALTDADFLQRLGSSKLPSVRDTFERWATGEIWDATPLMWFSGDRPDYTKLLSFSDEISTALDRRCFAYGIKDKRDRKLTIGFDDGTTRELGANSHRWLFGVASPKRRAFSRSEIQIIADGASTFFNTRSLDPAAPPTPQGSLLMDQPCLI